MNCGFSWQILKYWGTIECFPTSEELVWVTKQCLEHTIQLTIKPLFKTHTASRPIFRKGLFTTWNCYSSVKISKEMEVLWLNKITSELFVLLLFLFGIGGMRNWKSSSTSSNPTVGLNISSNRAKKLLCFEAESQSVAFQSEIELSSSFWSYRPDTFWGNFCFSGIFSQDSWFMFNNLRFWNHYTRFCYWWAIL